MDRWGSCADLLKNRRLLGCCCNLVKKMELNVLDSQNLLTEVLFDPVHYTIYERSVHTFFTHLKSD